MVIEITDTAKGKLNEVLSANEGKYLRVFISGIGWGGPQLGLALDEPGENENTTNVNGIDVLISEDVKPTAELNKIDYIKSPDGEGFVIGPKSGQSCC